MNIFNLKDRPPSVSVKCNWDVNIPGKTVEDTVLIKLQKDEEGETNEEDINDILDVEKTVNFTIPEKTQDKPLLKFKISEEEDVYFGSIRLLCDTKIIEVFGDHNIYLETYTGKVIEEGEDFNGYEFKIDLAKKINKEISIRFVKLSYPQNFWIYGILLKLRKLDVKFSSIRYENVEELIKDVNISEPASKCLKFLKESANAPHFPMFKSPGSAFAETTKTNGKSQELPTVLLELKQYIDYKFQVLTEFLILREKNTNDKLDMIMEYMRSNHNKSLTG